MLITVLAHVGQPPAPHDLWRSWNLDPALVAALIVVAVVYRRGRRRGPSSPREIWRARAFVVGLGVLALALLSPLEALSGALASAHMVQHVLLILVAAPLLAMSAPSSTLLRGTPAAMRRVPGRLRHGPARRVARMLRVPSHPVVVWILHVAVLWFWHSAWAYDAALRSDLVHGAEHTSFVVTAYLFWRVVIGVRGRVRVPHGLGVLLVFGAAMQSVLLSVLLTFASEPWYEGYATTTDAWGLDHLADQQLAGVVMWVPAGAVYVLVALAMLAAWIRTAELEAQATDL